MNDLIQLALPLSSILAIALCFVWSGFVRSGLGFGGAALSLPVFLQIVEAPLIFLPALAWQLLFFSTFTVFTRMHNVSWRFLGKLGLQLAIPFGVGLFGLLSLPANILAGIVYLTTFVFGIAYVTDRMLGGGNKFVNAVSLGLGGYVSGIALIGAPLIVAASSHRLKKHQVRDTFFVFWIGMVICKLSALKVADIDLQWKLSLLTLPLVGIGHFFGLKLHNRIVNGDRAGFNRLIGTGLCLVSFLGLYSVIRSY
ncbi:MAG: hypothetical protein V3U65_07155 [Granulosicoccaceae bacterium]